MDLRSDLKRQRLVLNLFSLYFFARLTLDIFDSYEEYGITIISIFGIIILILGVIGYMFLLLDKRNFNYFLMPGYIYIVIANILDFQNLPEVFTGLWSLIIFSGLRLFISVLSIYIIYVNQRKVA